MHIYFQVAYEHHISLKYSYIILAILHVVLVGISTFVFFPVVRFGSFEAKVKGKTAPNDEKLREEKIHFLDETLDETPSKKISIYFIELRNYVNEPSHEMLILIWALSRHKISDTTSHTLQTNPRRHGATGKSHKILTLTRHRKAKQSKATSSSRQDDCKTRKDTK